nr:serine hydrolase [Gammaproteobacteria bacterium]
MRKLILFVLSTFATVVFAASNPTNLINAQANAMAGKAVASNPSAAQLPVIVPPSPDINAKGYVLMDANSDKIIASKNMHEKMAPASLTKLMTLYVTFQALAQGQVKLSDSVRISKNAWQRGGSRMFLKLGSHVPLQDLIRGIITASGNDACVATAEFIAGKES